jgi:hypothetical protein
MSDWERDVEGWLTVLREDGPTPSDEQRHRAKLVGLGLLAGGSVVAASEVAQAAAGTVAAGASPGAALAPAPSALGAASSLGAGTVVASAGGKVLALSASAKALAVVALATGGLVAAGMGPVAWMRRQEAAPKVHAEQDAGAEEAARRVQRELHRAGTAELPAAVPKVQVALPGDPSSAREKASRLRAETSLIQRALAAERMSDWAAARRLLDEHERRFPNGALAEEREHNRVRIELKRGAPMGERDQK